MLTPGPVVGDDGPSAHAYRYRAGQGLVAAGQRPAGAGAPLAAADSWLVEHGRVRALDRHRLRFTQACATAAAAAGPDGVPGPVALAEFWAAVVARLPRTGCWFPRVELAGSKRPELWLLLRSAPPLGTTVRLWLADTPDKRSAPRRKGPDLGLLAALRARAAAAGADDALLTTRRGIVLEGAATSLLWWEGDRLCLPAHGLRTLPGVTSGLLVERARQLGIPVARRRVTVAALAGCEVWAVNALHGLRPVTTWLGSPAEPAAPTRAATWQRWLQHATDLLPR